MPPLPKTASETMGPVGSMVMTKSAPSAASAGLSAALALSRAMASTAARSISNTATP